MEKIGCEQLQEYLEEIISCDAFELHMIRDHGNEESSKEALMACRCMKDEMEFASIASTHGISEEELIRIKNELSGISRNDVTMEFENKLEAIAMMNANGQRSEYQKTISNIIFNWKEEYRRICRI